MMSSRILFGSSLTLAALALLCPLTAGAQGNAEANSLSCKLGARVTVTNNGPAALPAGTRIVVRMYPAPGVIAPMTQKILRLKDALPPGGADTSLRGESGAYQECTARVSVS